MLTTGIILGLIAAVGQALSYLPSRWFVLRRPKGLLQLLCLAHVMQGLICLPLVWLAWPSDMPHVSVWWKPLLAESLFYFLGQAGLFTALRHTDASRVSPLLGVKVVILAILSTFALGQVLTPMQWAAAVLAVVAALVLNQSGGSIPWRAGAGLLMAWTGYSLSDFYIRVYVDAVAPLDPLHAGFVGMFMSYLACGLVGAAMLPWYGSKDWKDWRDAAPFAFTWFAAMICFYGALATAGLVLAAILQSTRSFWSLLIGAVLAHRGYHALEKHMSAGVLVRRGIGAAMMVLAVTLYAMQSYQHQPEPPAVEAPMSQPASLDETASSGR